MNSIIILGSVALFLMLLFAFLRASESAFIRIPSEFMTGIPDPKPSDYRTEHFVDKPAAVLVAFSTIKYLIIVSGIIVFLAFWFSVFPKLDVVQNMFIAAGSFLLFLWLFGELIPAWLGLYDDLKIFKAGFVFLLPAVTAINLFRSLLPASFARHERRFSRKDMISMSDISDAIENSEVEDEEIVEKQLIKGVIHFGDLEVKEIMRSRVDVVAVQHDISFTKLTDTVIESGYSRFPVYGTGLDDIKGILHLKDILPAIKRGETNYSWQSQIRQAFFVHENMEISQLLSEFQSRKMHMSVVVDEYGGTSGIVTLEDLLEEIVGEINDEHDAESDATLARKISENQFVFDAKIPLHDLIKTTGLEHDFFEAFEGEVETLGGVILSVNGNFPERNQLIRYKNIEFMVLSMQEHRIGNVKMTIHEQDENQ